MGLLQQESGTLRNFLHAYPKLVVLTGAGVSSDSGIPTYRDQHGNWQHQPPVQEQDFLACDQVRRRYWTRSWHGWPLLRDAQPNAAHHALATLEKRGHIDLLITQNVDRLHQRAGSDKVVDLHGRVDRVRCLSCRRLHARESIQHILERDNQWTQSVSAGPRPDGDMDVPETDYSKLSLPYCSDCSGELMPDVVFFGGSVPGARVTACFDALEHAEALLAVGSSLMVFSGFRFCRRASQLGKPIAIINPGVTRADHLASIRLHSHAGPLLTSALLLLDSC